MAATESSRTEKSRCRRRRHDGRGGGGGRGVSRVVCGGRVPKDDVAHMIAFAISGF